MTLMGQTARMRRCAVTAALALAFAAASASAAPFNPRTYKGKMGSIALTYRGESSMVLRSRQSGKTLAFYTKNGEFQAPTGSYDVRGYQAVARDSEGKWTAYCLTVRRTPPIVVAANSTRKVDFGPPFAASINVSRSGRDRVSLGFDLGGAGGHRYIVVKGGSLEPPGFEMIDRSGQVVWEGNFKFG